MRKLKLPKEAIAFQPDAVEVDERRLPFIARFALYLIVVVLVLAVVWASVSEIDKLVSGQGKLVTRSQPLVVQPLSTSVIRSIDVRVGDVVKKGQLLATLDPTFAQSDVSQLRIRSESLNARIGRLEAEMRGEVFIANEAVDNIHLQLQAKLSRQRDEEHRAKVESINQREAISC